MAVSLAKQAVDEASEGRTVLGGRDRYHRSGLTPR